MEVTSGDIFGLYPRSFTEPNVEHVIVYPRIFPITQLGLPSLFPRGEIGTELRLFEDPTRSIGVRDYDPRDSLRHIHWKASARHQNLQVKVFEPTTTLKTAIFIAIDSFFHDEVTNQEELESGISTVPAISQVCHRDDLELGISTAASIASYLTEQSNPVGLFVNCGLADSGQPARIPPGSSPSQLVSILESLAKVTASPSGFFEQFIQTERQGLLWGTSLVIILSRSWPSLSGILASLREAGFKIVVLQIGDEVGERTDYHITWYKIRKPDDLAISNSKRTK